MKLAEVSDQIRSYFAERAAANEERSRQGRVALHPHKPECTQSGDIVLSLKKGNLDHTIEVFDCSECHSTTEFDRTQRIGDAIGTFGLWR